MPGDKSDITGKDTLASPSKRPTNDIKCGWFTRSPVVTHRFDRKLEGTYFGLWWDPTSWNGKSRAEKESLYQLARLQVNSWISYCSSEIRTDHQLYPPQQATLFSSHSPTPCHCSWLVCVSGRLNKRHGAKKKIQLRRSGEVIKQKSYMKISSSPRLRQGKRKRQWIIRKQQYHKPPWLGESVRKRYRIPLLTVDFVVGFVLESGSRLS